ncbi:unnamed protein product [Blepharisma stoltei]|uniref:Uncharacterized protein n=1 Tax=Blepharisma stoltei TaxID=1481888 RepID=A0AAU9IQC1_9CILI|nr:unnamed protein product [Blepharisma stoltei]
MKSLLLFCLLSVFAKGQEQEGPNEILLQENITFKDNVDSNQYRYYRIPYHYGHKNITIKIIPSWGDPDLYVNINSNNILPSKKAYDYISSTAKSFEERKEFYSDGKSSANCPSLLSSTSTIISSPCFYHIAIYGYSAASYTFTIISTPIMPAEIWPEWQTTISTKFGYDFNHFSIINSTSPWTVSLVKIIGKGSIYFSIHDYAKIGKNPENWPNHNYTDVSYQMITNGTNEEIYLGFEAFAKICPSETCVFLFCITCYSYDCSFNFTIHQLPGTPIEENEEEQEHEDKDKYKDETDNSFFDGIYEQFSFLFEWPYIIPTLSALFFTLVILLWLICRKIRRVPKIKEDCYQLLSENPEINHFQSNMLYTYGPPDANLAGDSYADLNYIPEYNRSTRTINLTRHYQDQGSRSLELYRTVAPLLK